MTAAERGATAVEMTFGCHTVGYAEYTCIRHPCVLLEAVTPPPPHVLNSGLGDPSSCGCCSSADSEAVRGKLVLVLSNCHEGLLEGCGEGVADQVPVIAEMKEGEVALHVPSV